MGVGDEAWVCGAEQRLLGEAAELSQHGRSGGGGERFKREKLPEGRRAAGQCSLTGAGFLLHCRPELFPVHKQGPSLSPRDPFPEGVSPSGADHPK